MIRELSIELDEEKRLLIPQAIHSTKEGFIQLFSTMADFMNSDNKSNTIIVDFKKNTWFDANLLPIVYAFMYYGNKNYNIQVRYSNQTNDKFHKLLIRNNFARECFGLEYKPKVNETVVPFKIFRASDTYRFGEYIDAEIIRYFPKMEERVKRDLSIYIQELFGNAQIHGNCDKVFTCGQYYHMNHKMDFTIVDVGYSIKENVVEYLAELSQEIPKCCIAWAVEPEHSTKRTNSGGIGLSLMHDFIYFNNGKFQIISGDEFWELNAQREEYAKLDVFFPGTIVNIEIDQNDKNYYKYQQNEHNQELF